jgi:hypothetical protein
MSSLLEKPKSKLTIFYFTARVQLNPDCSVKLINANHNHGAIQYTEIPVFMHLEREYIESQITKQAQTMTSMNVESVEIE